MIIEKIKSISITNQKNELIGSKIVVEIRLNALQIIHEKICSMLDFIIGWNVPNNIRTFIMVRDYLYDDSGYDTKKIFKNHWFCLENKTAYHFVGGEYYTSDNTKYWFSHNKLGNLLQSIVLGYIGTSTDYCHELKSEIKSTTPKLQTSPNAINTNK